MEGVVVALITVPGTARDNRRQIPIIPRSYTWIVTTVRWVAHRVRRRHPGGRCYKVAVIDVIDANDIVLGEVAAGLHLDQFEIDLARIGQPVFGADRQINRLVLVHKMACAVERHFRGPADNDPVLGAMIMLLQRQPTARPDDDALDLISGTLIYALIIAPGAIVPPVLRGLWMLLSFQPFDKLLDLVRLRLVGDQDGVSVDTTITLSRPMTAARCWSERTSTFDESIATTRPGRLLPDASWGLSRQTFDHWPTSDQPTSAARTAAFCVRSITA